MVPIPSRYKSSSLDPQHFQREEREREEKSPHALASIGVQCYSPCHPGTCMLLYWVFPQEDTNCGVKMEEEDARSAAKVFLAGHSVVLPSYLLCSRPGQSVAEGWRDRTPSQVLSPAAEVSRRPQLGPGQPGPGSALPVAGRAAVYVRGSAKPARLFSV